MAQMTDKEVADLIHELVLKVNQYVHLAADREMSVTFELIDDSMRRSDIRTVMLNVNVCKRM